MKPIRVALADDHTLFRRGLRLLLEQQPDMAVVGEAADGESCIRLLEAVQAEVVLMDVTMPGQDGIATTKIIFSRWPAVRVVGLTMHANEQYFFRLLQAGAVSYLLKGANPEELLAAIRMAARGETYLEPALAHLLVAEYQRRRPIPEETDAALTDREESVLRLIASGKTGREIAEQLVISPHTVERHRSNLLAKLGVHNKVQLIRYAMKRGLVADSQKVQGE